MPSSKLEVFNLHPSSHPPETTREYAVATWEERRRTVRRSGEIYVERSFYVPKLTRLLTLDVIETVYSEYLGNPHDVDRLISAFGKSRQCFPTRLIGLLLIELSKKLYVGHRVDFLHMCCESLHQVEGLPRVVAQPSGANQPPIRQ